MTFKEFMHTPNPYLDKLAEEAEAQRIINEEAAYDNRYTEPKKEIKRMRYYALKVTDKSNGKSLFTCRIAAENKAAAQAFVDTMPFKRAKLDTELTCVKKDPKAHVHTRDEIIAGVRRNRYPAQLPTKKDCAPAPSTGYAGNPDYSVDYKAYKVTKKQLDYLTYLLARYGDSSKTPRQLTPAEVSKSIQILKARSIHDPGRSKSATEARMAEVKINYLKQLYVLING